MLFLVNRQFSDKTGQNEKGASWQAPFHKEEFPITHHQLRTILQRLRQMRDAKLRGATDPATEFPRPEQPSHPIVHADSRPTIELKGGVTWSRLTALAESGAEFLEINYAPGAMSGEHMSHHEGREFGLVLEGELLIELGFESYTLRAGDSIVFESTTPHRLINKNAQPMRAVWVVMSPR